MTYRIMGFVSSNKPKRKEGLSIINSSKVDHFKLFFGEYNQKKLSKKKKITSFFRVENFDVWVILCP